MITSRTGFPSAAAASIRTKSFLRQRAEAKRERIEALADKAYGRKIVIQFGELDPDTALREVWKE